MCRTRKCRAFGTWIGRIVKTYDYINRVDKRFRLWSMRVRRQHSPLSLLCITMILRVRRNFFEITMLPNRRLTSGLCKIAFMIKLGAMFMLMWMIQVILVTSMSYFGSAVLLDEAARTDITRTLTRAWFYRCALHTGGWRVSVSPTLVESSLTMPGSC